MDAQPATLPGAHGAHGAHRAHTHWKRLDLFKVFCLLVMPLFLLVSYWAPLRGRYPSREELRDVLRELDDSAYAQSGCDDVAKVLARCEQNRVECPSQFFFDLRTINRNCHALRCARGGARRLEARGRRSRRSLALSLSRPAPSPPPQHQGAGDVPARLAGRQVRV